MATFNRYRLEVAVAAGACAVVCLLGLSMYRLSYDVWAGVLLAPVLIVLMVPVLRRILGADHRDLFGIALVGFMVKLAGSCLRYYVVIDAYGKNADAERYFDNGSAMAAAVRAGRDSPLVLLPLARDARFIDHLAGTVLTVLGPTRVGGFFAFSTFAYMGTIAFVRAAAIAIPGLEIRRYAWCCVLAPSLAFWPSSLGKEAWIIGCVGFFSLGLAKVLTWQGRTGGFVLAVAAVIGTGAVRPHLAAIFLGAATVAVLFSVMLPPEQTGHRRRSLVGFTLVAVIGLAVTATAAVNYLDQSEQQQGLFGGISSILERTSGQTDQGGSAFTPVNIDNPTQWPFAVARTLTRPLLIEANSVASLIPALETTLYLVLLALGLRRLRNLPALLRRSPFLMYAIFATFLFGLAFAAVANLGILVRQRSLVVPFMLLFVCIPPASRTPATPTPAYATLGR